MKHYQYLVIGGGLTVMQLYRGIRELDATGSIAVISMSLTRPTCVLIFQKGCGQGRPIRKIWRNTQNGDDLLLGAR